MVWALISSFLAFIGALLAILSQERAEVCRLRIENAQLMARVGYEYNLHLGNPPMPVSDLPIEHPTAPPLLRMKPPRSER